MFKFRDEFDLVTGDEVTLKIIDKYQRSEPELPFYWWDIFADGKPVGKISLRIGENFHSYYNGNIGYEVDSEHRGNGYAYMACKMVLSIAKLHGMDKLIISCEESNIASYKTIEKLGGKLLEIAEVPKKYFAWNEDMEKQRIYEIII